MSMLIEGLFNIIANYFRVKIIGVGWCDDWGVGV